MEYSQRVAYTKNLLTIEIPTLPQADCRALSKGWACILAKAWVILRVKQVWVRLGDGIEVIPLLWRYLLQMAQAAEYVVKDRDKFSTGLGGAPPKRDCFLKCLPLASE